jgi:hypothetical protein
VATHVQPTEPGWYPDPRGEAAQRKWDGEWLDFTRGPSSDPRYGRGEHLTDLDYLDAIVDHLQSIRNILRFWLVVVPVVIVAVQIVAIVTLLTEQ